MQKIQDHTVTLQMILFLSFVSFVFKNLWLIVVIFLLSLCAIGFPSVSGQIERIWLALLEKIGHVNRIIISFLVYFLVIVPYGVVYRLFRKGDTSVFWAHNSLTYYKKPEKRITTEHFEKLW